MPETLTPALSGRGSGWGGVACPRNVWEWCWDGYEEKYDEQTPGTDPSGPSQAALRVGRGGGWDGISLYARSAVRMRHAPGYRDRYLGFRVARGQSSR
jgi:formylglycine-generating enzyme required for sulfatase activity